jgi:hypothetical protein
MQETKFVVHVLTRIEDKELYTSFVPITEKVPEDFEQDDIEALLAR